MPIVHVGPYGAFASRNELEPSGERFRLSAFALEPLT